MTDEEIIEFERLKTARDSLLLKVANLRGQLDTIAADEREACAKVCEQPVDEIQITDDFSEVRYMDGKECADAIRARGTP